MIRMFFLFLFNKTELLNAFRYVFLRHFITCF